MGARHKMSSDETRDHTRVTMHMLYQKQLDNEKLLIQLTSRLEAMENLPKRVYDLEIRNARNAWIEKIAWAALASAGAAIVGLLMGQ